MIREDSVVRHGIDFLRDYVAAHNECVRTGDWEPLGEWFAEDAELVFEGVPVGPSALAADECGLCYVIEEGRARVTMSGEDVGELGPGDHFGEIALIAETPRAATVTAETELRCYGMTSWDFRALVERNGEIAWEILASTARKLYENAERERLKYA